VQSLSAEGRLSGLILGALPIVFGTYLALVRPSYIRPLYTTPMGVLLLVLGCAALLVGGFWMSRVIKVEV
jgi:tight adherence protein B